MSKEQAQAILLGLALGDALGRLTEFKNLQGIKQIYGSEGILEPPDPALYTDDTQMTIAIAEGLLLDAGLDAPLDLQMEAIGKQFIRWKNEAPSRAPGATCLRGVEQFESGIPWYEAGLPESKGCGSAMRVAPIGYLYRNNEERLREVAQASSVITHRHPTAIAAAVAGAYLVKLALGDAPPTQYIPHVLRFCADLSAEFDAAITRVEQTLHWDDEEAALRYIGEGWAGEEAIALALYCVLRYPDDYVACVRRAANSNGDSDSIACIAGGIMGARLGLAAIPAAWIHRCENRDYLLELGEKMAEAKS